MARAYAGTVMLEGTTLSEGRGTTRPLELLGAPGLDPRSLLTAMDRIVPAWIRGCRLRPCWFEPTFQKHAGKLCAGFQIHVDDGAYDHGEFRPWRLIAGAFKCIRRLRGEYPLWRDFPYEYEKTRLAIDLINGSELLREWVDDPAATPADLDKIAAQDEAAWAEERAGDPAVSLSGPNPLPGQTARVIQPCWSSRRAAQSTAAGRSCARYRRVFRRSSARHECAH